MRILGIDPGFATMGYGLIEMSRGTPVAIDYGVITTPKDHTLPKRLLMLEQSLIKLIDEFKPDQIAIEELFFTKNITTGIAVSEARGVILLTSIKNCEFVFEYTPNQIKQAITGSGRADKRQMQKMVQILLKLKETPKPDDAADALAVAICHGQTGRLSMEFRIK